MEKSVEVFEKKRSVLKLQEISAAAVLSRITRLEFIDFLVLPTYLKDVLKYLYMKNLLYCDEVIPDDFD